MGLLTPSRERGFEFLDDPTLPADVIAHSLRDVSLANRLFGGTRAMLAEVRPVFKELARSGVKTLTLLDVGTGLADIPVALCREAERYAIRVHAIGLELTPAFAAVARKRVAHVVTADARALPFADNALDVIMCSLVLHHLSDGDAELMLRECSRVARVRVVVSDLRRSWVAMALLWLVSFPLRFHRVSRHDGVVSIRRGYTVHELRALVARAGNRNAGCRTRAGWRVTAAWQPGTTSSKIL